MQPAFMQAVMHSQQAWHIAQQSSSPLVQVMHTPILVSVHSHLHIDRLHWQITMPFIMHEQLHMLPAIILHMFCKVVAAISSSQVQVIFMPPLHFSIFIVQRGTMHICMPMGTAAGIGPACIEEPAAPIIPLSSINIVISKLPFLWPPLALDDRYDGLVDFRAGSVASAPLGDPVSNARNKLKSLPLPGQHC
jgi:hypothetical protein